MMLIVGVITALGLYLAQRKVAVETRRELLRDFQDELAALHGRQEIRHAALAERGKALVVRPRIHAALEDNALDLLYPTARDELRDVLVKNQGEPLQHALNARFYRFLDGKGALIAPPAGSQAGGIPANEERRLSLPAAPVRPQFGYFLRDDSLGESVDEVLALPIQSTETGAVVAALVLGFEPLEFGRNRSGIMSGLWVGGRLHLPGLSPAEGAALDREVNRLLAPATGQQKSTETIVGGVPHLLFVKQLNPGSLFPPAYEVALYSLAEATTRRRQILWYVLLAGLGLLALGLGASHLLSRRLSQPVEVLAVTSEQNRAQRERAEAALETTSQELKRSTRFSADASHQLKTPVTVLRAGIEELLGRDEFQSEVYDHLSQLLHQTYRITGVVDDLLLLSRMDAGRLEIQFDAVNLSQLLEEWVEDFGALPNELDIELDTNFPPNLHVAGEKRYISLIVQNLLENARKYNVRGGDICVAAERDGDYVKLNVRNTGPMIPPESREQIFERFQRGPNGENVPGHGLGLNLARELAHLLGGDLRLVRSDAEGTEFEVRFSYRPAPVALASLQT